MISGTVREIAAGKGVICRGILDDLPEWFAVPESVEAYVCAVERLSMLGFVRGEEVLGFISVKIHNAFVAEAYVIGVKKRWHRSGIGRKLFDSAEQRLRRRGLRYLTVKTLAADRPNEEYAHTRLFYDAIGFIPVEVFPTLWGPQNPCLLMIKPLDGVPPIKAS
jgi:ribosomal protein S18 acetylase RimI-like enzyme